VDRIARGERLAKEQQNLCSKVLPLSKIPCKSKALTVNENLFAIYTEVQQRAISRKAATEEAKDGEEKRSISHIENGMFKDMQLRVAERKAVLNSTQDRGQGERGQGER
jgi:hypothetical protein